MSLVTQLTKNTSLTSISSVLLPYQEKILAALQEDLKNIGEKSRLRDACDYAITNGGKRFRPAIVLMVAEAIGSGFDAMSAALAVEYFHTASLIADDLPCMDDDDERRCKPALHRAFDETTALLVTYVLIARGYELIAVAARSIENELPDSAQRALLALENATFNTGLQGATGGQYLDIFPPDLSLATLREIIHKKTVTLFEISFVFGWLFGGGSISQLDSIKKAASHFGMAFQIADDIDDIAQDSENSRSVNLAVIFGLQKAKQLFLDEIEQLLQILNELNINAESLKLITQQLHALVFD